MWILPSFPLWASSIGLLKIGDAAALRSGLKDPSGPLHRIGQLLAIRDRQAAGLFAVNVLAGLGRHHRCGGMPAIAGRDQHGVDVLAVEQLAEVAIEFAVLVSIVFVDQSLARIAAARLHVGDRDAPHVGQTKHRLQVVRAAGTDADHPERDSSRWARRAVPAQDVRRHDRWQSECGTGRHGPAQKIAARFPTPMTHLDHLLLLVTRLLGLLRLSIMNLSDWRCQRRSMYTHGVVSTAIDPGREVNGLIARSEHAQKKVQ